MMFYSHWLSTSPIIILFSLIFLGVAFFAIKKSGLGEDGVKKNIFFASVLAILMLMASLVYTERGYGGTNFLYKHGLPHFYLIEESSGESMSRVEELKTSKNIFMKSDLREISNGIIPQYLNVNFLFWFSVSFFLLGFVDILRKNIKNNDVRHF